jgi:predicted pyridoxine 5'-phosphate oxidase superfamily flavin-nucleotide-binding protein
LTALNKLVLQTVPADPSPTIYRQGSTLDRIVVADVASTNTVRNIRSHPSACASLIDVFRQCGFKVVGAAMVIGPEEPDFRAVEADLLRMAESDFPTRHLISIQIERVSRIWAPSYALFPGRTERERMQSVYETYGVLPAR